MVLTNALRVRFVVAALVNSVFVNLQANKPGHSCYQSKVTLYQHPEVGQLRRKWDISFGFFCRIIDLSGKVPEENSFTCSRARGLHTAHLLSIVN